MEGECPTLLFDRALPTGTLAFRLRVPLEEVGHQHRQAAGQFPLFAFAHVFYFLGDMFQVEQAELTGTQQPGLFARPSQHIGFVTGSRHTGYRSLPRMATGWMPVTSPADGWVGGSMVSPGLAIRDTVLISPLVAIGQGEAEVGWVEELLVIRDRARGGVTAPPQGLYFVRADYPMEFDLPQWVMELPDGRCAGRAGDPFS